MWILNWTTNNNNAPFDIAKKANSNNVTDNRNDGFGERWFEKLKVYNFLSEMVWNL